MDNVLSSPRLKLTSSIPPFPFISLCRVTFLDNPKICAVADPARADSSYRNHRHILLRLAFSESLPLLFLIIVESYLYGIAYCSYADKSNNVPMKT